MEYQAVIQAAFSLIAAVIAVFVIPYIRKKTTAEQRKLIEMYVKSAVLAAEQIYRGENLGAKRFEYVVDLILKDLRFNVDKAELLALIESEVYNMTKEKNGV